MLKRKRKFEMKNFALMFLILVLTTSIISFISAAYSRSFTAYTNNPTYVSSLGQADFPLFDREMCGAGQDFIVQVSPLGCTPAVVRSDLLEDQNVPVFCPIVATQLNPLIDINAIDSISFSGQTPPEVSGIGYQPARAALGKIKPQIDSPILNNVGYAVIVLKKQANSSRIPDFVEGNLTARMRYDIKNAFGVGQAVYYLPELTDDQWEENFPKYSFWEGRGYLRAEEIGDDTATISIYSDRETYGLGNTAEKRKLSTDTLKKGETSREIPMPGFNYCLGTMQIKLNDLENPDTRVRLGVNGDSLELKQGEKFLDTRCKVTEIEKRGVTERAKINCQEDEKSNTFNLIVGPRVRLAIGDEEKEFGIGDFLYNDGSKSVYLGFVGSESGDPNSEEDLYIRFISIPESPREKLTNDEIAAMASYDKAIQGTALYQGAIGEGVSLGKKILSGLTSVAQRIVEGRAKDYLHFGQTKEVFGKRIHVLGFAGAQDTELSNLPSDVRSYYEKVIEDYNTVREQFSQDKYPQTEQTTLGEQSLFKEIEFLHNINQKRTALGLCTEFSDKYPNSQAPGVCANAAELSSSESSVRDVSVEGKVYRISVERIIEPTSDEFGAQILVEYPDGDAESFLMEKSQVITLSENEFVQLNDLERDSAKVKTSLQSADRKTIPSAASTRTLELGVRESFGSNYYFTLQKVNLKKVAKVSIIPQVNYVQTEANFKFKIGIEKRGIQLSPEKTKERIDSLNQTLNKWQDINSKLGTAVSGFKAACLATGTALTVKNFFLNIGGEGIARQKVMRGEEGWFNICEQKVKAKEFDNVDACLLANSGNIDASVQAYSQAINSQNTAFETLQQGITRKNFLGEEVVNTTALMNRYITQEYRDELQRNLQEVGSLRIGNENVPVSDILAAIGPTTITLSQAKNLQLNSRLLSSSDPVGDIALSEVKATLGDVWVNSENERQKSQATDLLSSTGLSNIGINVYESQGSISGAYDGYKTPASGSGQIPGGVSATSILYKGKVYILQLEEVGGGTYRVVEIYNSEKIKINHSDLIFEEIQSKFSFKYYNTETYQNKYQNPELRYYEKDPYKGLPAIVPFDTKNGWYAAVKSTLPIGGAIRAYDDSGRVSSFWLCNVGPNGKEENIGGDDLCQQINLGTGQPYDKFHGLSPNDASTLVSKAVSAIEQASRAYRTGVSNVRIGGETMKVGSPAANVPDIQCQDFMSPSDCNILFNVCDPVICPSSRCDLGGNYPVEDVVQSGIVGSLLLCAPNFPEVKVPICLSGVHAGLESYLTVLDSYQKCLQTSLETGQNIGICDEINSVYMCEFFWRQSIPLAKAIIPKVIGAVAGQNVRGGGEYFGVQDAWKNAESSANFFTQYYAANSFQAFKVRSVEDSGGEICKNFISISTPQGGNVFDALTAPDSPSQFYGRFDEIPFTTATNPPVSQYKIFYHIYAGKDLPAYYEVYLRSSGSSFFQDTSFRRTVAKGFIKAGEYATATPDITAPSGYGEMCIIVNGREECGFKQVTTDFGINYVTDQYVASQASQTNIQTEAACNSGTPSVYSLLSPNVQAGAEEVVNPAIYNRGITRVCATNNPGQTTDSARWKEVGFCGDEKIKCWLDSESVKGAIKATNIEEQALGEVTDDYIATLKKEGGYVEDFDALVQEIEKTASASDRIRMIDESLGRVFFNHEKGYLRILRADAYAELIASGTVIQTPTTGTEQTPSDETQTPSSSSTCSAPQECQQVLGAKIIGLAKKKKADRSISDDSVKRDTGSKSFECLALQVAMVESSIRHCKQTYVNGNPLYCNGNKEELISGDESNSLGIMQINTQAHPEVDVADFDKSVNYALDLLISKSSSQAANYRCYMPGGYRATVPLSSASSFFNIVSYSGWKAALRNYNGWNSACYNQATGEVIGNPNYVDDVIDQREDVAALFSECK